MLKYADYDIVFQEIPDEITLAINISGCPNRCKGCHTPELMEDTGNDLTEEVLSRLVDQYASAITCVCFMGGDAQPDEVCRLSVFVKQRSCGKLKSGWYSGRQNLPENFPVERFDFVKLGPYIEACGGLNSARTNQRFYCIEHGQLSDQTKRFRKK